MATTTTNYALTKPSGTDRYDIAVQNGNMDKIDTQMKANADAIATKQATITGAATTIDTENLTASRALISNGSGKVAVSAVTSTELGYLDGVTSAIQTQLNGKLSTSGTAAKATADASGNTITSTYETKANAITGLSASGRTITYTKGNGTTGTITTQDNNTDTQVTQAVSTSGNSYPLLARATTSTETSTTTSFFASTVKLTPSTGTITATNFNGLATKATADASGNNIASTYATKDEVDALDTALDGKQATITGGATTITGSNLTASRALVSDGNGKVAVSAVTSTELGYLDGVTSAIQTQINGKQASISGGASTITSSNLTASRALISDSNGKVAVSAVTSTELGYLDGVTSAIQTQLNGKASSSHSHSDYVPKTGTTMTGQLKAQSNTAYTIAQVRNVILSDADPSGGSNGDVWFKYE